MCGQGWAVQVYSISISRGSSFSQCWNLLQDEEPWKSLNECVRRGSLLASVTTQGEHKVSVFVACGSRLWQRSFIRKKMKTNKKGPRGAGRTGIQSTGIEVVVSQK